MTRKSKAAKISVSALIRDAYLAGITVDELRLLDSATQQAGTELDAMAQQLKATNAKLDNAFRTIAALHTKAA